MPKNHGRHNTSSLHLFGHAVSDAGVRKLVTAILTALLVFLLLLWRLQPERVSLDIGDVALHTITANRAAVYVDMAETERLRSEARQNVNPVYNRDPGATAVAERTVEDAFSAAKAVRAEQDLTPPAEKIELLRSRLDDLSLSSATLRLLLEMPEAKLERRRASVLEIVRKMMQGNIRSDGDDLDLAREKTAIAIDALDIPEQFQRLQTELAQAALVPNQILDAEKTENERVKAAQQVEEVRLQLQPGDLIIQGGQIVKPKHLAMFEALGLKQPKTDYAQATALLVLVLSLMGTLSLFIIRFAPHAHRDERLFYMLCITVLLTVLVVRMLEGSTHYAVWVLTSVSTMAMFIATVISSEVALAAVIFLAIIVGSMAAGGDTRLLIATAIAGMAAAYAIPTGHSRTTIIARASVITALTNPIVLGVSSFVLGMNISYQQLGMAAAGGLASALLALGAVVVVQRPLNLVTEMRLIELLNPNEPLLKRMLTEAPGSYQSCVMVANLAEPAAEAIGANALLTRVQCMYHDIGKLKRPLFFAENQFSTENPHDHLSAHLSALVLMSHVKEGIELAEEAGLPAEIAAVLPQHHGTTLVSFLYRKAVAEASDPASVREADFRYDGPRPQSKETALVMLADTVEAAARTMEEPSPVRIIELVDRLIDAKIEDGQLDEAPLTLRDITTIKQSFVQTLNATFHHRTRYPDNLLPENLRGITSAKAQRPKGSQEVNGHATN